MTVNRKDLSIKTATITIKVIQVDGHKMTKATFNQIPRFDIERYGDVEDDYLNYEYVIDCDKLHILGYVNLGNGNKEILASIDGDIKFTPQNLNKIIFSNQNNLSNLYRWCPRLIFPSFNLDRLCTCRDDGLPQL
jgi:hypothetical protein